VLRMLGLSSVSLQRIVIVLIVILMFAVIGIVWQWRQVEHFMHDPLLLPKDGLTIQLDKGETLRSVWIKLQQQKVLARSDYPSWFARWNKRGDRIKAGEYAIPFGTTPLQLLERLERGDVTRYNVTLVEGWTFDQVINALRSLPALKKQLTDAQLVDANAVFTALNISSPLTPQLTRPPEGLFFPDTYQFLRGDSDLSILQRAYQRLLDVLNQEWSKRQKDLPIQTPYDALILASIVEKETGLPAERPMIAGVFIRRLQANMLLQTDPSVIYGLGARYDGNIRSNDLKDASNPYNTYRQLGLTPTPIALAGREAIRAALQPQMGKSLYFVARGDGSHAFSDTLDEHNKAVRKYQLERREDYRSAPVIQKEIKQKAAK
jgi:UPF0755 protein